MRRNIKNDKVIKAITIGLATMIAATSAPLDVLADEVSENTTVNNPQQDEQSQTEEQISDAVKTIEGTPANETTGAPAEAGALELIADADKMVDAYADSFGFTDSEVNAVIQQDLTDAANYIADKEGTGVKINGEASNGAEKDLKDAKTLVAEGYDEVDNANDAMENIVTSSNQVFDTANEINKDDDYNGKNDLVETVQNYADSANAASDYNAAVGFQGQAQQTYNNAATALEQAQSKYEAALAAKKAADEKFEAANDKIEHAQINSAEAYRKLVNAKSELANLQEEAKEKQKELEAIQKQYYALQVQYYRKAGINGNTTIEIENKNGEKEKVKVFGEDGKLNTDYAAQWIVEKNKVEANAEPGEEAWKIGRYLLKELVEAKLKEEGAENIVFGAKFDGSSRQDAWEVDVYANENENGAHQVIKKDANNQWVISEVGEKLDVYKATTVTKDRGRTNRFAVTYTKNGKPVTEYYNYVFKNPNPEYDKADLNMEEGPIYLAQIKPLLDEQGNQSKDEKGNLLWETERVEGAYDNYKELVNIVNQYGEAQQAVKDATDKVEKLQGQISEIQRIGKIFFDGKWISPEKLVKGDVDLGLLSEYAEDPYIKLVLDLKIAEKELSTAQENVEEAKRILDSIDLSRFNVRNDDPTGDGTGAGDTVVDGGDVSVVIPGGYTLPAGMLDAFGGTGTTGGGTTSGVLGVRTGGGTEADEGGAADSRTNVAPRADFSTVNKVLGSRQNKDNSQIVKKIKDNEIPLAEIPNMDDEVTMNWMWLLIIFLLGATGKKMYDEYKKKKEAEEAAKINK